MKKFSILTMFISLVLVLSSCSLTVGKFSTAKFSDIEMASEIDENNAPVVKTSTFTTTSPIFYVTGILKNAPAGTNVEVMWYYTEAGADTLITSTKATAEVTTTPFSFSLSIPDAGWPVGTYEVRMYIDDVQKAVVLFSVQ